MPRSWRASGGQRAKGSIWRRLQHETALVRMAPDVAEMLPGWHQTNWFTVQGAEKRALHAMEGRPGDPTADIAFAFAFARFHRKLTERLRMKDLFCCPRSCSREGRWTLPPISPRRFYVELPAFTDDFFVPVISGTAAELIPRVVLATQGARVAAEHGFQ